MQMESKKEKIKKVISICILKLFLAIAIIGIIIAIAIAYHTINSGIIVMLAFMGLAVYMCFRLIQEIRKGIAKYMH